MVQYTRTMYKTVIYATLLSLLIAGCSRTTVITKPDGDIWMVKHSANSLISYKKGGEEVIIDNRGRASLIEEIIKLWTLKELTKED